VPGIRTKFKSKRGKGKEGQRKTGTGGRTYSWREECIYRCRVRLLSVVLETSLNEGF